MLERAISIAVEAHSGQVDKGGHPYILHPLRVMMAVSSTEEKIVAVLHDVVEDSSWTFEALSEEGFSDEVVTALKSVTKTSESEDYDSFIERAKRNAIGKAVKIADLRDNMDITRITNLTEKDSLRLTKYQRALQRLESL